MSAPTLHFTLNKTRRYNVALYPDDVAQMDSVARALGCSRSRLITHCFRYWLSQQGEGVLHRGIDVHGS